MLKVKQVEGLLHEVAALVCEVAGTLVPTVSSLPTLYIRWSLHPGPELCGGHTCQSSQAHLGTLLGSPADVHGLLQSQSAGGRGGSCTLGERCEQ